jgi:hypothetical protein
MPIASSLLESPYFRARLQQFMQRSHHPRPAGRARTLHLMMQKPLSRGPTPTEVLDFAARGFRLAEPKVETTNA